jgi:hypothetical protein
LWHLTDTRIIYREQLDSDGRSEGYISRNPSCISNFTALYVAYELANESYLIEGTRFQLHLTLKHISNVIEKLSHFSGLYRVIEK